MPKPIILSYEALTEIRFLARIAAFHSLNMFQIQHVVIKWRNAVT